jgi:hypothetical protein
MPKYLLTWTEQVLNSYYSYIEADSEDQAWKRLENGADYELEDWDVMSSFDHTAEIVE